VALAVLKTSPYNDVKEFLAAAKAKPRGIIIGGAGAFSSYHMATTRLQEMAGVKFSYIPFTGGGGFMKPGDSTVYVRDTGATTGASPQITALMGKHVDAIFGDSNELVKYADSIRVLAVADNNRFFGFSDTPTFKESGLNLFESIYYGIGLPQHTPDHIVKKLESAFLQIAKDPTIQKQVKKEGFVPLAWGHNESKAHIEKMTAIYREIKDFK
jgi:tripartite-type tricarboxylate transporter receptor subunit TctC